MQQDKGVIYVAFGEQYKEEARRSLRSLRKTSDVSAVVVTDRTWTEEPRPDSFILREALPSFRSCPLYMYEASPFGRTLFLDTDTVVARDIAPVFGLLEYYDIGVSFRGPQLNESEGLTFHTQCSGSVILFRKCKEVADLFEKWLTIYDEAAARLSADDPRGMNDQRYLALAVARSRVRPVHLDSFLNFNISGFDMTCCPPSIYHGRQPWIEGLADSINETWDQKTDYWPRIWLRNIAGFMPRGVRRSDPILTTALMLRRLHNELKWRMKAR